MNHATKFADAIRKVTAKAQRAIDAGNRSAHVDAHDLIELLLAVADELDPPLANAAGPACPRCGNDDIDRLVWIDDEKVRCDSCGAVYDPTPEA